MQNHRVHRVHRVRREDGDFAPCPNQWPGDQV